jgi:hypothetical protein
MSLKLLMDVHIPRAITDSLRVRGVDVLTAQEDGSRTMLDPELLTRAGSIGRVVFSHDEDMLIEAARRQTAGEYFSGLIYAHPMNITIGRAIDDAELVAKIYEPSDIENFVQYLPL